MPDGWTALLVVAIDLTVRLGLSLRVVARRLPVGVSLAWLFVILVFPLVGAISYLTFGELRLGRRRAQRAQALHASYQRWLDALRDRARLEAPFDPEEAPPLAQLVEKAIGIPALPGNRLTLLPDWESAFRSLIDDIRSATRTCHLEFYIWHEGGLALEVAEALIAAAARGVKCRVLLDDVGSRPFLRSGWPARLRAGGVEVSAALHAGLWRLPFVRFDLRMHRKIVAIDGRVAYTGSMNLVDPRHFKQDAGVGEWIDAMVRVEGPAVEPLAITFLEDWALETGDETPTIHATEAAPPMQLLGDAPVQVAPTGPAQPDLPMQRILLSAIYDARRELVLTTPYFVPDEPLVEALISAAQKGVAVTLVLPERVDSKLVHWACRAFWNDLITAGVRVVLFERGLLHTKSVTVDGRMSLFGSLNLDPRSLRLNFEITLAIYHAGFTQELRGLQESYIEKSRDAQVTSSRRRDFAARFAQNAARLLGPLL